jgi:hypothetical protein
MSRSALHAIRDALSRQLWQPQRGHGPAPAWRGEVIAPQSVAQGVIIVSCSHRKPQRVRLTAREAVCSAYRAPKPERGVPSIHSSGEPACVTASWSSWSSPGQNPALAVVHGRQAARHASISDDTTRLADNEEPTNRDPGEHPQRRPPAAPDAPTGARRAPRW